MPTTISQAFLIIKKRVITAGDDWKKSANISNNNKKIYVTIYHIDIGKWTSNSG